MARLRRYRAAAASRPRSTLQALWLRDAPPGEILAAPWSHPHRFTRIASRGRPPLSDEFFELGIRFARQHHFQGDVFIAAGAARPRHALPLKTKDRAGVRPFRNGHRHLAGGRGNLDLAPEHSFAQRDWQLDMDIVALARENAVRPHLDLDQRISGRTAADARAALAAQAKDLAVTRARRNGDVEQRAVGKRELLLTAIDRIEKIERQTVVNVRAAHAIAAPLPAENFRQDIVHAREVG